MPSALHTYLGKKAKRMKQTKSLLKLLNAIGILTIYLSMTLLNGCKTTTTNECMWYIEPTGNECLDIMWVSPSLFEKCAKNKISYNEFCR